MNTQSKLIKIGKADYLMVKDRIKGWRDENPDAVLVTEILALMPEIGYAAIKATVTLPNGAHADGMGSATATALKAARKSEDQYLEFAETRAIGRALARLGYGTDDELDNQVPVDAPVEPRQSAPQLRPQAVAVQQSTVAPSALASRKSAIIQAANQLGWTDDDLKGWLKSRGFSAWADINETAGKELFAELQAKVDDIAGPALAEI